MSGVRIRRGAHVVVTGAGSGIGLATARRCARAGAQVGCVDIDAATADAAAADCRERGAPAWSAACDVANAAAVQALSDRAEDEHGPVDVIVNNAGVGVAGPFLDAEIGDWDWLMGVNLDGVAYGCHAFGARMVRRGAGHVVNVASGAAFAMSRDMAAYCASKAAVLALSRCLRAEWSAHGVGVSAICPGVINTPIPQHTRMVGDLAARQERITRMFRFGHSPDVVAKAIVRAVERDQAVVPVGLEAELAYRVLPLLPGPVGNLLTRTPLRVI